MTHADRNSAGFALGWNYLFNYWFLCPVQVCTWERCTTDEIENRLCTWIGLLMACHLNQSANCLGDVGVPYRLWLVKQSKITFRTGLTLV